MAKEKIETEEPKEKKPKELLTPVITVQGFSDGNLAEQFAQYGYLPDWPQGQRRELPLWLINRCKSSGAELEFLAK